MSRHSTRARAALQALAERDPAIGALSLWCAHRDVEDGPAAATQGTTIRYGPGFDALPRHEQEGLAAHHILHAALRHSARMEAMAARQPDRFDAETWNMAADAIVNEALMLAGYALPRPAVGLVELLVGLAGESLPPEQALAEWDADRLYIRLMQGPEAQERAGEHARTRAFRPDLSPEAAPEDSGQSAADWRQHLARAMQAGRMAGRGIGRFGHRIADLPVPETPWEVVLRRIVTRAVTDAPQTSPTRPARRWIAAEAEAQKHATPAPAFEPGQRRARDIPRIVVGLDTSSSIDAGRMAQFMGEVAGIARRTGAEVHVIPFDEAAEPPLRLDVGRWQGQLAGLVTRRGGGTDFRPALAAAMGLAPSVIVMLTDLEGPMGPAPRGVPVLWAVPDAGVVPEVAFGQVVSLAR